MTNIVTQDLHELLIYFSKNTYRAKDADNTAQAIMQKCILLADLDYTHSIISNYGGELCAHYPSHLIILENEKHKNPNETPPSLPRTTETIYESLYDSTKLKELMKSARIARCRSRFPLPVILYKGRHICRSATLSGGPEIYGRSGLNYLFPGSEGVEQCEDDAGASSDGLYIDWQLFDRVRNNDIKLLKSMNVGNIIDLMVEKKKVKYGMYVTSSEKVDKEGRYNDFTIIALPYPGCEFFREFRDNNYIAKDLVFNWSQGHVDTQIGVPEDPVSNQLKIQWEQYENWDLVTLTRNYLKLILKYLSDSSSGMLVHCISGWDRTPLFISLLRISLWADGAIHASMNTHQMLYYTIAYDWHLFGHDLQDRLSKGEEIFFFCFFFLKHIHDDEFSINSKPSKQRHSVLRNDSDCQLDNFLFENEPPIVGSVGSNISMSSANSRDSQENNPPNIFMVSSTDTLDDYQNNGNIPRQHYSSPQKDGVSSSRSPLLPNRTSPVAVPVPSRYRQRNESTSSAGSWQVISGTGSLHSSSGGNVVLPEPCYTCNKSHFGSCPVLTSLDSNATLIEDEIPVPVVQTRKDKLIGMRQLFYSVWSQTAIGFRMQDSSEGGLGFGQLLGNFAEKVGIISQQRTSL